MLNVITRSFIGHNTGSRTRCDVHDSEAKCPEYKVVSCRIRKTKKAHLRKAGEVVAKA